MQKQVKNTFMDRFFCNAYIKLIYFILILAQILYFVWEINEVIHPMKANMGKDGCGNVFYRKQGPGKFFDTSSPKHSLVNNILVYKTHFLFVRGPTISLAHICMRGLLLEVHFWFLSLHLPHSSSSTNWQVTLRQTCSTSYWHGLSTG